MYIIVSVSMSSAVSMIVSVSMSRSVSMIISVSMHSGVSMIVKPRLQDASNTFNVGYWKHSTHRVAEGRMTNDERPASNVGVGR